MLFDEDYRSISSNSSTTTTATVTSTSSSPSSSFSSSLSEKMFFLTSPTKFWDANLLDDSLVSERQRNERWFLYTTQLIFVLLLSQCFIQYLRHVRREILRH